MSISNISIDIPFEYVASFECIRDPVIEFLPGKKIFNCSVFFCNNLDDNSPREKYSFSVASKTPLTEKDQQNHIKLLFRYAISTYIHSAGLFPLYTELFAKTAKYIFEHPPSTLGLYTI